MDGASGPFTTAPAPSSACAFTRSAPPRSKGGWAYERLNRSTRGAGAAFTADAVESHPKPRGQAQADQRPVATARSAGEHDACLVARGDPSGAGGKAGVREGLICTH